MATKAKKTETAEIQKIDVRMIEIKIRGLSPIVVHRWDEKAKKQILDKQMKKTVKREAKDPVAQYESSLYKFKDGRVGFPADGFKKSMIRGAKIIGLVMIDMKTGFFVHGEYSEQDDRELIPIEGDVSMREDMVKLSKDLPDIRYRGQISNWTATIRVSYNAAAVSPDQIVNMLHAAGYGVGVGEWRPDRDGMFGRFEVLAD
jgi:hypothetical protein